MIAKTKAAWTVAALTRRRTSGQHAYAARYGNAAIGQFGFTASEYERARVNILKSYENI